VKIKTRRTVFLIVFFLTILLGMLCVTGCPSTQQHSVPSPVLPISVGTPTYKVYVKGLVCPACAVGLKKYLLKLSFVGSMHINYKTGLVLIFEKQSRDKGSRELDKMRITKVVENSGYDVDKFVED